MTEQLLLSIVDVLIIGAGPAGLSAALTLARQRHTAVIFDSGSYRCDPAREFNIIPTWEHKTPQEYLASARKEVLKYETVQLKAVEVLGLTRDEEQGVFEARDIGGTIYKGKKVIIASGVQNIYPDIAGYEDCWGKGIFHCLFCHGYEQSSKANLSAGVLAVHMLAMPAFALHMAHMAAQLAPSRVTIYTDGNETLAQEVKAKSGLQPAWKTDNRKIRALRMHDTTDKQSSGVDISFEDGSKVTEGLLAHAPLTKARGPWAEQLGLAMTPMGDYEAKPPVFETSVKGVYAAGDCMTPFKVAANAIANGSVAGSGVAIRLQEEKHGLEPIF
ncbi:MAG: hypothetical protein MMC33_002273 [Icmadophila ericetorum]|nr:hypothetical protein [Icmadophila ericetorum]